MVADKIQELRERHDTAIKDARALMAAADAEQRDLNEDEERKYEAIVNAVADIKAALDRETFVSGEERYLEQPASSGIRPDPQASGRHEAPRGIGQIVTESREYKDWLARYAPNGDLSENQRFEPTGSIAVNSLLKELRVTPLVTGLSDTSGGAFVSNQVFENLLTPLGRRELTIRDLVTNLTTNSDTVEFVRITTETNAAAGVLEATSGDGATGLKPSSEVAMAKVTAIVETIAHLLAVTNRTLADASQLRGYIDNFLRYGLEEELEDQMINGNGTTPNLRGIAATSNVQSQAFDTNIVTTARKGISKVRVIGKAMPTGFGMHPYDWEDFDLLQDNEARYYYGGPAAMGTPRLWGLPVVQSQAFTEGVAYVAEWRQAVLWDREQAAITVGTINDDFARNIRRVLAELRAAFGVLKPVAFCSLDLTP